MKQPTMKTLSNRAVAKLKVEKDTVYWDRDLTGFGVRVYPTGSKVYVAQARGPEGPRRVAVGRAVRRGLDNMKIQSCLTATAINLKRLAAALVVRL